MPETTYITTIQVMKITSWEELKEKFGKMPLCKNAKNLMVKKFGEEGS